jgi:hypothetical protein
MRRQKVAKKAPSVRNECTTAPGKKYPRSEMKKWEMQSGNAVRNAEKVPSEKVPSVRNEEKVPSVRNGERNA